MLDQTPFPLLEGPASPPRRIHGHAENEDDANSPPGGLMPSGGFRASF
jgi:hypothetical protein